MADKHLKSRGLRILIFGNPGSGKSSLLGALWQAAQAKESNLKITNPSGGLAGLRDCLYGQQPCEFEGEMAGHPITFEANGDAIEAVLIDTNGKLTQEHLTRSGVAEGRSTGARAAYNADALIFVVDPTRKEFDKDFQNFCEFIESLETTRSHHTEIAGLPIYLVMTKCDMFGKPAESYGAWVKKIEEYKRRGDKKFQEIEAKFPYSAEIPFGKADVRVWATAVKRPALADRPAKAQEPYGVAELFRQCLQAAHDFHALRQKARGQLGAVLVGFILLISAMLAAGGLFFVSRPGSDITTLEGAISEALPGQKNNAVERLKEPLEERLAKLDKIIKDPTFAKLLPEQREEVLQAKNEIQAYIEWNKYFQENVPDPKSARGEQDLKRAEDGLQKVKQKLPEAYLKIEELPKEYHGPWKDTKLAKKYRQYAQDVLLLRSAVDAQEAWFKGQIDKCKKLQEGYDPLLSKNAKRADLVAWLNEADKFLAELPKKDSERLPNSTTITYGTAFRFRKVEKASKDFRDIRDELIDQKHRIEIRLQKA